MKRLAELDVLRGILLLMMVVNHSPAAIRSLTDRPLGFFSTAEGFVFVSAFLAGMLFRRRSTQDGFVAARSYAIRRAARIYWAHLLTLSVAFVIGSFFLAEFPGVKYLLDRYLENPRAAIVTSAVLLFCPPLMDILPMYILFSLLTPFTFWAARRLGWKTVILASLSVWLISQTGVRDLLLIALKDVSYVQLGAFDILAWQLLWIGGLFIGQLHGERSVLLLDGPFRIVLFVLAVGFLGSRWMSTYVGWDSSNLSWLLDKWHLGPLRLINFFVTGWLISELLPRLNRWERPLRPLSLIGRHMLLVFCCQTCLSVLLIGIVESLGTKEPLTSLLVIFQLFTAFLLAWFFDWRSRGKNFRAGRVRTDLALDDRRARPPLRAPSLQPVSQDSVRCINNA